MSNKKTIYHCPFCEKKYIEKKSLYSHMEEKHPEQLKDMSAAQVYFNFKNKKTGGKCIICGKPTKFNETTEKYERLCNNPKCKEKYVKMFQDRMKKKYGTTNLLNNPEQQKKMLANRKISGKYKWSKPPYNEFLYTGTYEKEFLEFMDIFMNWDCKDIFAPAPMTFTYMIEGKKHFYIPDFFIESLNLIVEVKSYDNNHYRQRDIVIEKTKDKLLEESNFNYFKVHDKEYDEFFNYVLELIKKNDV